MGLVEATTHVEYPETDGKPMGETDLHIDWMFRLREMLRYRYRGQRVYVACDLLLYYEEGNPRRFVVPDIFVVKDTHTDLRRTYKLWEEGRVPNVAIEVTSKATKREDRNAKPKKYAQIGIAEYFLYDPTGDYLDPALQGFRLSGDHYEPIQPNRRGRLLCEQLGLWLNLDADGLVLHDVQTGRQLLSEAESVESAFEAERAAREAAEEELRRLREELRQRGQ